MLAAAFTLFVYISKWNALGSKNKFKNYWVLGVAMQIVKNLTHLQPSTCVNKNVNTTFSAPNSSDPEQDCDSIYRRHPDYGSTLISHHSNTMKNCVKDRIDFSFNCHFKIKHTRPSARSLLLRGQYFSKKARPKLAGKTCLFTRNY